MNREKETQQITDRLHGTTVGSSSNAVLQCAIGEIDVGYKDGTQSQVTLRLIPESCVVKSTKVYTLLVISNLLFTFLNSA